MMSAMFASPYYLDQVDPRVQAVESRVQTSRQSIHARGRSQDTTTNRNTPKGTYQSVESDADEQKPTIMQRRASLDHHLADVLGGTEIPNNIGPTTPTHKKKLSAEIFGEVDMPYVVEKQPSNGDERADDDDTPAYDTDELPHDTPAVHSNGLPQIELSSAIISFSNKDLRRQCRSGFNSEQRSAVWPRLLVLPSSVVHVDVSAYYRLIEQVWHYPTSSLTALLEDEDTSTLTDVQLATLRLKLPTTFPAAPTLGRAEPFDWTKAIDHEPSEILAQKRILCALCATNELKYASQLPPLVAVVYHALQNDEARTYSFVSAMLERSKRDEHFLILSPVSMELLVLAFKRVFQKHLPDLDKHFSRHSFDASEWFRTQVLDGFLASTLPREAILRVWDTAILVGSAGAYIKFALTIYARFEQYLLSGNANQSELEEKLSKLLRMVNLSSFFGSTLKDGLGWQGKEGWYDKQELAKLTAVGKEASVVVPMELQQLEPRLYHVPVFFDSFGTTMEDQNILNRSLCHQLYSGLLPAAASSVDPYCIYSTSREGHSLKAMMQTLWDSAEKSQGTLLLVRTIHQRRTFGVFFSKFPQLHDTQDSRAERKTLRTVPLEKFGLILNIDAEGKASIVTKFVGAPWNQLTEVGDAAVRMDSSSAGISLPVLPVEGGPGSSTTTPKSARGPETFKRRGSLAVLLDALHLKKIDDGAVTETGNALNTEQANKLLSDVAPLSPFKHPTVRIFDSPTSQAEATPTPHEGPLQPLLRALTTPRAASGNSSAPASPRRASSLAVGSSASTSQSSTAGSTPSITRRQSIVASLERVWSFIDSVPTPHVHHSQSVQPSLNNSPAISRRQSLGSATNSPVAGKGAVFFPSAPTSAATTPTRKGRTVNPKAGRGQPAPPINLPPRSGTDSTPLPSGSPQASPAMIGLRQRSNTATEKAPNITGLERRISMQRVRDAGWDSTANAAAGQTVAAGSASQDTLAAPSSSSGRSSPANSPSSLLVNTPGSASHHYRLSLTSPAEAVTLAHGIHHEQEVTRGDSSNRLSSRATTGVNSALLDSCPTISPAEPELLTGTPSPEEPQGDQSAVREQLDQLERSDSPIQRSPSAPSFVDMSAAFRAQHPFHLAIDDLEDSPMSHCDTVRAALRSRAPDSLESIRSSKDSSQTPVGAATVLLSDTAFILTDPSIHLVFSLSDELVEGTMRCDGLNVTDQEEGQIQCAIVEAWAFLRD